MAITKETCIAEGEQLFRKGAERPEGSSWQVKAKQQGYDCAQTDAHDLKQDEKAEVTPNPNNHPAIHHLDILRNMEESETNPIRKERLLAKMVKLGCKWANRGVMW